MAQINSGWTYESSGVKSEVTAENLNAHVNNAELAVGAIKDQDSSLLSSDTDEMLQAQGNTLVRLTKANFTKNINSTTITATTVNATTATLTTLTTSTLAVGGKPINGDSLTPVGSVSAYIALVAPVGWLLCNGQSLNAVTNTQYEDLWLLMGLTFGGTGKADFKVPDLRGEFIRGWSSDRTEGTPAVQLDGRAFGSSQEMQLEKHKHTVANSDCQNYYGDGTADGWMNYWCDSNGYFFAQAPLSNDGTHPTQTAKMGNETRPRNVALNYIIKF